MRMEIIKIPVLMIVVSMLSGCGVNIIEEGATYLEEQKYEEALEAFEKSVEKDKDLGEAYRGMGIAYYELEEYEEALSVFEKALENDVEETGTLYNLIGICNMKLENYEQAYENFEMGISMNDSSEELLKEMEYNQIFICEKIGDWETAKQKAQEYVAKYPDDAEVLKEAEFLETR